MDPKLAFWTFALVNLLGVVVLALLGVRQIRARRVQAHRRLMTASGSLVVLFLVAYLVKVATLGREDRADWTTLDRSVLYVHEIFVVAMLVAGGVAVWRAMRFRGSLPNGPLLPPDESPGAGRRAHRRAGWVAVVGACLGFLTAIGVLAGMYARA